MSRHRDVYEATQKMQMSEYDTIDAFAFGRILQRANVSVAPPLRPIKNNYCALRTFNDIGDVTSDERKPALGALLRFSFYVPFCFPVPAT